MVEETMRELSVVAIDVEGVEDEKEELMTRSRSRWHL